MTQSTEQECTEFEAWLGIKPCGAAHDLAWSAWQAARRSPVVPKGWRLVPVEPTSEMLKAAWKHGIDDEAPEPYYAYKAMLATAPQPPEAGLMSEKLTTKPEAAPVQLPEPVAYLHPHGTCASTDEYYGTVGWTPLYTEQVRQLLDAAPKPPEAACNPSMQPSPDHIPAVSKMVATADSDMGIPITQQHQQVAANHEHPHPSNTQPRRPPTAIQKTPDRCA